jgi:hypothetical protein
MPQAQESKLGHTDASHRFLCLIPWHPPSFEYPLQMKKKELQKKKSRIKK